MKKTFNFIKDHFYSILGVGLLITAAVTGIPFIYAMGGGLLIGGYILYGTL